ncbi:aldo/keto reductase [Streptomyces sp. NPDC001177]
MRNVDARWQPDNFEKNVEAVGKLGDLAATNGVTVSQLALARLLTRGDHVVPIPGAPSLQHIEKNAAALPYEHHPEPRPEGLGSPAHLPPGVNRRIRHRTEPQTRTTIRLGTMSCSTA